MSLYNIQTTLSDGTPQLIGGTTIFTLVRSGTVSSSSAGVKTFSINSLGANSDLTRATGFVHPFIVYRCTTRPIAVFSGASNTTNVTVYANGAWTAEFFIFAEPWSVTSSTSAYGLQLFGIPISDRSRPLRVMGTRSTGGGGGDNLSGSASASNVYQYTSNDVFITGTGLSCAGATKLAVRAATFRGGLLPVDGPKFAHLVDGLQVTSESSVRVAGVTYKYPATIGSTGFGTGDCQVVFADVAGCPLWNAFSV